VHYVKSVAKFVAYRKEKRKAKGPKISVTASSAIIKVYCRLFGEFVITIVFVLAHCGVDLLVVSWYGLVAFCGM